MNFILPMSAFIIGLVFLYAHMKYDEKKDWEKHVKRAKAKGCIILRYEKGKPVYGKSGNSERLFTQEEYDAKKESE